MLPAYLVPGGLAFLFPRATLSIAAASMDYLDFDLEIGEGAGREYPVAVLRSPAGEARATMRFPYDELALENRLLNSAERPFALGRQAAFGPCRRSSRPCATSARRCSMR